MKICNPFICKKQRIGQSRWSDWKEYEMIYRSVQCNIKGGCACSCTFRPRLSSGWQPYDWVFQNRLESLANNLRIEPH
jgi:hypothetical protein